MKKLLTLFLCVIFSLQLYSQSHDKDFNKKLQKWNTSWNVKDYNEALLVAKSLNLYSEDNFGKYSAENLTSLYVLSQSYSKIESYNEAIKVLEESYELMNRVKHPDDINFLHTIDILANKHYQYYNYNKALKYFLIKQNIIDSVYGKLDYRYIEGLRSVTLCYIRLNELEKALKSCLELIDSSVDTNREVVESQILLIEIYNLLEDHQQSLAICKNIKLNLKLQNWDTLIVKLNYIEAEIHSLNENLDISLMIHLNNIKTIEQNYSDEYYLYETLLSCASKVHFKLGNFKEALKYSKKSYEITLRKHGKESLKTAKKLESMAYDLLLSGKGYQALKNQLFVQDIYMKVYKEKENNLDHSLRVEMYQKMLNNFYFILNTIDKTKKSGKQMSDQIFLSLFNQYSFLKGRELNTNQRFVSRVRQVNDSIMMKDIEMWENLKREMYYLYEKDQITKQEEDLLLQLNRESRYVERKLVRYLPDTNQYSYTFNDIESKLKKNEIYIDIISSYNYLIQDDVYFAFIIQPEKDLPLLIRLGEGNDIERHYNSYIEYMTSPRKLPASNDSLTNIFFSKLAPYITDGYRVFISPDGIFSKVNINSFYHYETQKYLIDKIDIVYVLNTTSFINYNNKDNINNQNNKDVVLIGNPKFLLNQDDQFNINALYERSSIKELPGTKIEIDNISKILLSKKYNIKKYTEEEANEFNLKRISSPRILHIATHGYFHMEPKLSFEKKINLDPNWRSGLILSGAENSIIRNSDIKDNGWFTSQEASLLNLNNTDLVVLSACETGLGVVENGKGVLGFQNSIKIAGAETIIMSLWSVSDKATQELMSLFYDIWINNNKTKRESFKLAQKKIRKKYTHPFYWAPFIIIE